jgi:hypothetical protein
VCVGVGVWPSAKIWAKCADKCYNVNQSPSCVAFNRTRLRIGTHGISRANVNSPALQLCCATLGRSKHDGARQAPNLPALVQAGASVNVPHSNAPLRSNACVVWSTHTRTYARRWVCGWVGELRVGQWNVSQHGNMTAKCWTKIERQVKQVHAFTKPLVHMVLKPWLGKT